MPRKSTGPTKKEKAKAEAAIRRAERQARAQLKAIEAEARRAERAKMKAEGFIKSRRGGGYYKRGDHVTPKGARYGHGRIGPPKPRGAHGLKPKKRRAT